MKEVFNMKKLNKKGFTIVELVIVIAVIAILAAVLIPTFSAVIQKANQNAAMQAARNAFTTWLADDNAENLGSTYLFTIESNGYYFKVQNGVFSSTPVSKETVNASVSDGTLSGIKISGGSVVTSGT
jgi:prepilin-type N-terminal cleavage/methylation domain-containing protein